MGTVSREGLAGLRCHTSPARVVSGGAGGRNLMMKGGAGRIGDFRFIFKINKNLNDLLNV